MTEQRKYRDDEVKQIFEVAARRGPAGEPRALARDEGLTLDEIQSIGAEAGIEPTAIAQAAAALDAPPIMVARRTVLGAPVAVGRMVQLPRALTDAEWEQLVVELRATFGARGRVAVQGNLREWWNGNLHACIEPGERGAYRLRLGSVKGNARPLTTLGVVGTGTAAIAFATMIFPGADMSMVAPSLIGAAGVAAILSNLVRLPRWARTREQQMDYIAAKVLSIVQTTPPEERG
jgi:hypothetical protein